MTTTSQAVIKQVVTVRCKLSRDLVAVAVSWLLVVAALYTATMIVGSKIWGGMAYFGLYAVLGATLFGVGLPVYWMVVVRKRTIADLGVTTRLLGLSIVLQVLFAALLYVGSLAKTTVPPLPELLPLVALALTIGLFEAIFWRGWMLLRLEEAFGLIPAIILGSVLYAAYHIGYGMPTSEMVFLFFIGILYAVTFRITKNVFLLWPLFQPMGQLVTLIRDGLSLPTIAALGFFEALILMGVVIWLGWRYQKKHAGSTSSK